ncbi:MAG: MBL fold metallo-hydrolase [Deltaproteobacteria bacterium]|nr:MBL fold metallo-hydrolase [Deltaproteobacteria bacterium]
MLVRFWGVRGSLPSPPTNADIRAKITQAITIAQESFLAGEKLSVEELINKLPPHVPGFVGGHTPCLEISQGDRVLIFDAGTGIRELGSFLYPRLTSGTDSETLPSPKTLDLFFTHTHWDHIQGFPFFAPIYDPNVTLNIYALDIDEVEKNLKIQQSTPHLFPMNFDNLSAKINFHKLTKAPLELAPFSIDFISLPHPGGSTAYKVKGQDQSVIFATDYELLDDCPTAVQEREQLCAFIQNATIFISDSQYTYLESHSKEGWGHSNALNVVNMAQLAGVKDLYLFHHDPNYNDEKLFSNLEKANIYNELLFAKSQMGIHLAIEGLSLELPQPTKTRDKK